MTLFKSQLGRPPKYERGTYLGVWVPWELKVFLKELSKKTGRSISDLVVEALLNYYNEVKIGKVRVKERKKRSIDLVRELEIKRIERELKLREKNVAVLEKARAQGIMTVNVGRMTTIIWDAIIREQNCLYGLIKKCLGLERYGLDLYKYVEKATKLIERLEKIK